MRLKTNEVLFTWPLAAHTITAGWYYSDGSLHRAIDLRAAVGTPVCAAEDGTVDWVQTWDGRSTSGNQSYGNLVRIRHADYNGGKLQTLYAHLQRVTVKNGQAVRDGEVIGYSGNTGNSTGPHLHFEVRLNGTRYNPLNWLDDDFSCAYSTVRLGSYTSVNRPAEGAAAPALQTLVMTLPDGGAAAEIAARAAAAGERAGHGGPGQRRRRGRTAGHGAGGRRHGAHRGVTAVTGEQIAQLTAALTPLLGAVCGYLAGRLQAAARRADGREDNARKQQAALVDGVKSLLRGQILDDGLRYLEQESIPPGALETLESQHDAYVRLGDGDKSINDIVDRCRRLPICSGRRPG